MLATSEVTRVSFTLTILHTRTCTHTHTNTHIKASFKTKHAVPITAIMTFVLHRLIAIVIVCERVARRCGVCSRLVKVSSFHPFLHDGQLSDMQSGVRERSMHPRQAQHRHQNINQARQSQVPVIRRALQ